MAQQLESAPKPALVLNMLHFNRDFFYKTRASLARAEFKRDFLYNHESGGGGGARVNVREKGPIRVAEPSPLSTSYPFGYERNPL